MYKKRKKTHRKIQEMVRILFHPVRNWAEGRARSRWTVGNCSQHLFPQYDGKIRK